MSFKCIIFFSYHTGTWIPTAFILILKRPSLCGWLRSTQFKPRLDWVGSAALLRGQRGPGFCPRTRGFRPAQFTVRVCGPRNSRSAHFAAHALDVLATHESHSLHNLVLSGRVKNVYRRHLRFLTLMFNNKVKNDQYVYICYFWDRVNPFRPSDTYMCRLSMPVFA